MQINPSVQPIEFGSAIRVQAEKPVEKTESKAKVPAVESPAVPDNKAENLARLKEVLSESNLTLKFRRDDDTQQLVVELVDDKTGEAIRQIPSQISLKLAAAFVKMQGQFVDTTE